MLPGESCVGLPESDPQTEAAAEEFANDARGPRVVLAVDDRPARGDEVQTARVAARPQLIDVQRVVTLQRCIHFLHGLAADGTAENPVTGLARGFVFGHGNNCGMQCYNVSHDLRHRKPASFRMALG
ncbi:MAG: hypothetical protein ACK56I_22460, partial [bacterium]